MSILKKYTGQVLLLSAALTILLHALLPHNHHFITAAPGEIESSCVVHHLLDNQSDHEHCHYLNDIFVEKNRKHAGFTSKILAFAVQYTSFHGIENKEVFKNTFPLVKRISTDNLLSCRPLRAPPIFLYSR